MVKNRRFEDGTAASGLGVRHLQCALLFCGLALTFAMRVNLALAIVAITDKNLGTVQYAWSEKTKSIVLSSFFWGYIITQVPGGHMAQRFGGKILLALGISLSSLFALLTPICVKLGNWQMLCALRVAQGLSQGVIYPSSHTIISKWAPAEERATLSTLCYTGTKLGTVLMFACSGVIASSSVGWPGIFYYSGSIGILWSIVWCFLGSSSPEECKSITAEERNLISFSINKNKNEIEETQHKLKAPWSKIFSSMPFLVLIVVHCAHNWSFWTLCNQIPSYMKHVLGMDIKKNALLTSLPYTVMLIFSFVFCGISSVLSKRKMVSATTNRKLFNTISMWIPAITVIALAYVTSDQVHLAVILLTITVGINSASFLGFVVNHIDLSPNFAGILMGVTNCAANIMGIIAPLIVGLIVTDVHNPYQWRIVFFITGGVYFFGNLLFIIFGKATVQRWNEPVSKTLPGAYN